MRTRLQWLSCKSSNDNREMIYRSGLLSSGIAMVIWLICLSIKWATEIMPTFLGLAGLAVMADDTHAMV